MRIVNTFDQIQNCFMNHVFDLDCWRKYTKAFSQELSEKCETDAKGYNFEKDILPVINRVQQNKEEALLANASFVAVAKQLDHRISELFPKAPELDILFYLGLCNGAGWATTLDGRDAILIGLEKILELGWQNESSMQALIFHEVGHIWHKTYGVFSPETRTKGEASLAQLYQEGIAMVCEQILCQHADYYHQNQNGWLNWCVSNQREIKQEFLRRIDSNLSTQDFFGDWCNYQKHSDVGYYLGCEFVKHLQRQHSLVEIANLDSKQLNRHFRAFVCSTSMGAEKGLSDRSI